MTIPAIPIRDTRGPVEMNDVTGLPAESPAKGIVSSTRFALRNQYDDARDRYEREQTDTYNDEPSLTNQQFTEEANLNVIVARFGVKDGAIPPAVLNPAYFGDFCDAPDFRQALDNVREAQLRFDALPASVRSRFHNNPVELWEFVHDDTNEPEAIKLGLLKPLPPVADAPGPPDTSKSTGVT